MEWLNSIDPSGQILPLCIAVGLGAFIGLRREMDLQKQGIPGFVGFRTMPLITLLGCVTTMFPVMPFMPVVGLIAIIGFLFIAYYNGVFQLKLLGLTSELSTVIMYLVGVLVGYGYIMHALLISFVVAGFAAFKNQLHNFAKTISPEEWSGALQLGVLSAVVLPVLPRTALDPWGVLVPYDIWLVVVFISAIGFVGYFLNKYFGASKGTVVTALVGSLVSSTVVTTHMATLARDDKHSTPVIMFGLVVAITTMLLRVSLVLIVLAPMVHVANLVAVPAVMVSVMLGWGLYWYARSASQLSSEKPSKDDVPHLSSPFDLVPALKFGALFVVVLSAVQLGRVLFGQYGVIATTFFSAFADVDAAVVSVLQTLRGGEIEITLVALVITIALVVNTMIKSFYVWVISRKWGITMQMILVTASASIAGVVTYIVA